MSALIRFNNPVSTLMDELFNSSFPTYKREEKTLSPRVDITEEKDGYTLLADLPGMDKNDVKISVEKGILSISGERIAESHEGDDKEYRYYERTFGSFERRFRLPEDVDAGNIKAKMKNGVLELKLKKDETKAPQSIEIK